MVQEGLNYFGRVGNSPRIIVKGSDVTSKLKSISRQVAARTQNQVDLVTFTDDEAEDDQVASHLVQEDDQADNQEPQDNQNDEPANQPATNATPSAAASQSDEEVETFKPTSSDEEDEDEESPAEGN